MSAPPERNFRSRLQQLAGQFVVTELYLVGNSPGDVLLIANPLRSAIGWSVHSNDVALVTTKPNALAGQGLFLVAGTKPEWFFIRTHGALVQAPWYVGGVINPFQITIVTVDYHEDW